MAKIEFNGENSKKRLTLGDCEIGDIILLNEKIYIIVGTNCYSNTSIILNLSTIDEEEFLNETVCGRCQKTICFNRSDFQEYID